MGLAERKLNAVRVLAVNSGSTSLKLERYVFAQAAARALGPLAASPTPAYAAQADRVGTRDALALALAETVDVVAHRFVRVPAGSPAAYRLDATAIAAIGAVGSEAPLHDAAALEAVAFIEWLRPGIAQFAVSDSAFHRTLSDAAATYAIPRALTESGLRRIGFHGLSHEYAAHRACALAGLDLAKARVVTAHLGGGSSLCAVSGGASIDTTMGYTPLDGLPMATRCGSVDPGILLHLLRSGTSAEELGDLLESRSGLLGISDISGDLRELLARKIEPTARLALGVLAWRLRAGLGSMIAALGGVDAIAFTGGIGERAHELRTAALAGGLGINVALDPAANERSLEGRIERTGSGVALVIVVAREGWQLARAAVSALARDPLA